MQVETPVLELVEEEEREQTAQVLEQVDKRAGEHHRPCQGEEEERELPELEQELVLGEVHSVIAVDMTVVVEVGEEELALINRLKSQLLPFA